MLNKCQIMTTVKKFQNVSKNMYTVLLQKMSQECWYYQIYIKRMRENVKQVEKIQRNVKGYSKNATDMSKGAKICQNHVTINDVKTMARKYQKNGKRMSNKSGKECQENVEMTEHRKNVKNTSEICRNVQKIDKIQEMKERCQNHVDTCE